MDAEFDYDLTPDQWEALKALRAPARNSRAPNRSVLEQLIALSLVAMSDDGPVITPKGRSVLLRGSPRLWDLAA
jgi:ribosomal protein S19E (S16A)